MKALLLAAGFGTRLRPLTEKLPKPLIEVNHIPLIGYNLAQLKKCGITDIVMNLYYLGHKLEEYFGSGEKFGLKIEYSKENEILGTGGGVKQALSLMSDDFLVMNSDTLLDVNIGHLIKTHKEGNIATFLLRDHPDKERFGKLYYKDESLLSILEEPENQSEYFSGHYAGVYVANQRRLGEVLQTVTESKFCIFRDAVIPSLKSGGEYGALAVKDIFWSDCGTHDDLKMIKKSFEEEGKTLSYQNELRAFA